MTFLTNKYPRTMHFPFSLGAKNDDRIIAPDYWEHINYHDLIYTEKLDGENCCLTKDGVYARSHAVFNKNAWASHLWQTQATIKYDLGDLEIFGENMYAIHSIEYNKLPSYFFVFAVRELDVWYDWGGVQAIAKSFKLNVVPEYTITARPTSARELEALIITLSKTSHFGNTCEGIVVRRNKAFELDDDNFGYNTLKYVRKNHVQTDEHWTRNWKKAKLL